MQALAIRQAQESVAAMEPAWAQGLALALVPGLDQVSELDSAQVRVQMLA
jgi:hypothetical protein